jgi:hypothetical protein
VRKTVDTAVSFDDPNAYIAAQVEKYQARNRVLQDIVSKGDRIRATATGFEQVDNRKCTCKSYGARRKDHAEECAVEIVTDPTPVIAALKEIRLNDTYLDGLRKQVIAPDQSADITEAMTYLQDLHTANESLRAECAALRRQLDASYAEMRAVPADVV